MWSSRTITYRCVRLVIPDYDASASLGFYNEDQSFAGRHVDGKTPQNEQKYKLINREDWLWEVCIYLQCSLHYYYCIIIRMSYPRDATFDDVYNRVVGDRNVGPIPCTSGYINNLKHLKSLLLDTRILDWDTTLFSWKFDWSIIWSVETAVLKQTGERELNKMWQTTWHWWHVTKQRRA